MKRCDYCGKESETAAEACHGCGTLLPEPPTSFSDAIEAPPLIVKATLNAAKATQVFLLMFVAQTLGGMIAAVILLASAHALGEGASDQQQAANLVNSSPAAMAGIAVVGALGTIAASFLLVRPALTDTSPAGAAWVLGSRKDWLEGLGLGVIIALGAIIVNTAVSTVIHPKFGPLTQMGITPGIPQITYIILAVLIAPAPEELLFRGVMYGGYFQSFGPRKAAVLTTALFVLMHSAELIYFLPAALGIVGLALAALHMRLRASAIGPAIAVHFAYNSVVATLSVLHTLLNSQ